MPGPEQCTRGSIHPQCHKGERRPLPSRPREGQEQEVVSNIYSVPIVIPPRDVVNDGVGEVVVEDNGELGDSREELPTGDPTNHPVINDEVPSIPHNTSHDSQTGLEASTHQTVDAGGDVCNGNLLADAKLYQDAAVEYKEAFHSLKD